MMQEKESCESSGSMKAHSRRPGPADVRLRYISGPACLETKALWREVFYEDSDLFTDYYFRVKAPENEGFVLEGEEGLRAMLFLTPERMRVFEKNVQSAYIVGVATREQFRHRGYMARLLQASMELLYGRRVPFGFLMPASAAIYEPFGFRFIYDRPVWDAASLGDSAESDDGAGILRMQGPESIGEIAAFSQAFLEKNAAVYICRDAAYDRVLLEEMAAQEGCVFGYYEKEADAERLRGVCLYTCEGGEADIQEVLGDMESEAMSADALPLAAETGEKRPCIMARILHLPAMLELLRAADPEDSFEFLLHVTDEQITENNGYFLCHADGQGCSVRQLKVGTAVSVDHSLLWSGNIAELVQRLFGYPVTAQSAVIQGSEDEMRALRPEDGLWKRLRLLNPVWINEIV